MGRLRITGAIAAVACLLPVGGARSATTTIGLVDVAVSFTVANTNTSKVPCPPTDGRRYTVAGRLIDPPADGHDGGAVSVYLHGAATNHVIWQFDDVVGYDVATALARAGHTSVVIDRLGYLGSGQPAGAATCLGAQ